MVSVSARDDETDEIVVEAATTEGALAQVASRLGPGARIASAEKVLRGGVGGFFQREVVQVRAVRDADAEEGGAEAPAPRIDRLLADLSADADGDERSFSEVLRERLGAAGTAGAPEPGSSPPRPWSPPQAADPGDAARVRPSATPAPPHTWPPPPPPAAAAPAPPPAAAAPAPPPAAAAPPPPAGRVTAAGGGRRAPHLGGGHRPRAPRTSRVAAACRAARARRGGRAEWRGAGDARGRRPAARSGAAPTWCASACRAW